MAKKLRMTEAAERLGETLAEEEQADTKLTSPEGLTVRFKRKSKGRGRERRRVCHSGD